MADTHVGASPLAQPCGAVSFRLGSTPFGVYCRGMLRLRLDPLPIDTDLVLFDLTRLYRARQRPFATGIDRIDLRIGLDLLDRFRGRCRFVADLMRQPVLVPQAAGAGLLRHLAYRWFGEGEFEPLRRSSFATPLLNAGLRRIGVPLALDMLGQGDATYVVASHSGIGRLPGALTGVQSLVYLHDLIPLTHPEHQRVGVPARFEAWLTTLAVSGSRFVANSGATAAQIEAYAADRAWQIGPVSVVRPRVDRCADDQVRLRPEIAEIAARGGHFVTLGTIEPRKNHLMLLTLWREMAGDRACPDLHVVGRRGWEIDQTAAMLDRCAALAPFVQEHPDLSDVEVAALLGSARALLLPSFAEGLGIPLLEAQALSVPAIASDLPALREVAAPSTQLLDPWDARAWRDAIRALISEP